VCLVVQNKTKQNGISILSTKKSCSKIYVTIVDKKIKGYKQVIAQINKDCI
jgi:hypothetical protein